MKQHGLERPEEDGSLQGYVFQARHWRLSCCERVHTPTSMVVQIEGENLLFH